MMSFREHIAVEDLLKNGPLGKVDYKHQQTSRSETYVITVDNRNDARSKAADYLKKNGVKFEIKSSSKSSFDPIFIDSAMIVFKPKKTGSDAKTTAMQENTSAWIFKRVLNDNKRYSSPRDILEDEAFKKEILGKGGIYPTVDDEWVQGFYAQQKKMLDEFSNAKFTAFNRDGGFMDWITKLVSNMGIKQKDTWNPADIWLVNNESTVKKEIVDALGKFHTVAELNAVMRRLYNDRRLVGISLKKISGKVARYEEINVNEIFGLNSDYGFNINWSQSRLNLSTDNSGKFGTQDMTIIADAKKSEVKFQIKQNDSSKRSNLKFEPTQKGAGSARLGKVPLDMLQALLSEYNVKFVNNHRSYPDSPNAWGKVSSQYVKKFDSIKGKIRTEVTNSKDFVESITRAYLSGDRKTTFIAISKLMQIDFLFAFLKLSSKDQEEVITDMVFLAMKKGKQFGPHGKLFVFIPPIIFAIGALALGLPFATIPIPI